MTNTTDALKPTDGAAEISIKIPPDEYLAGDFVTKFLEAGYDISVERVFSDSFDPPRLDHYLLNIVSDITVEDSEGE